MASDRRNNLTVYSDKAEWFPQKDLLIVQDNLKATHPNLEVTAKEGHYFTKEERLELRSNILATAKDPPLQIRSDHLWWQIPEEMVIANQPLQIDRYDKTTITDRLTAKKGSVDLKEKIAVLEQNIELKSLEPPVQVASNSVKWELKTRIVKSNLPLQIIHRVEEIIVTGNRGEVQMEQQIARFSGGVEGESKKEKGKIYAEEVVWNLATQRVEGEGNVIYSQAEPELTLTGSKAVGTLEDKQIVVTGEEGDRAVTEIVF